MNRLITACFLFLLAIASAPATGPDAYDLFYDDGTSATLNEATVNLPQSHAISGAGDWDWVTFRAEAGMPYSVKLEQVGADVDLELDVFVDGLGAPAFVTDTAGFGGGEIFSRQSWPATGRFWIAVHAYAWREGVTSYTLTVTRNTGANLGLATISGTKMSDRTGPAGGSICLPQTLALPDGSTITPLYTRHALAWSAGTFTSATTSILYLGGLGDPINSLSSPYVTSWMEKFPHNLSITRVGLSPAVNPPHWLSLTIELISEPTTINLSDGVTTIPNFVVRDVPSGADTTRVHVWHWSKAEGVWKLFDASPGIVVIDGAFLVMTNVNAFNFDIADSDFFAAAFDPVSGSAAENWAFYK
ncbi:hypothetical protein LLG95_17790 [bacterium]|nr:hypothetical protein [bacterium]